jgi:hypothetical protein
LYTIGSIIAFDPLKVSRDYVDDIRGKIRSEFVVKCWESIRNKIVCILVHYIPNLADEVEKILHFIENIKVDCSPLRRMVTGVIEDVKKLNHLESSLSLMMSLKQRALEIEKLKVQLKNYEALEEEASRSFSTTHAEITKIKE